MCLQAPRSPWLLLNQVQVQRSFSFSLSKMTVCLTPPLPATREEFEDRAVLYGILMDLEYFLQLKKEFADALTQEQVRRYWGIERSRSNQCVYGADQIDQTELTKE